MTIRKAVLPAAGLGTRFLPATKSCPKEMLPLVDKPLIQYVIEEAISAGIKEIILITGRGKSAIEDYFDISFELESFLKKKKQLNLLKQVQKISRLVDFCYIRQKEPLGLGHAVLRAKDLIGNEPFAVLLGDDIIEAEVPATRQLINQYNKYQHSIIALEEVKKKDLPKYGIIDYKKSQQRTYWISDLVEKPKIAKAPSRLGIIGRYILTPEIFPLLEKTFPDKKGEIQLTDGLKKLLSRQPICGYLLKGKRYDAGNKLGLLKATVEFALRHQEFGSEFKEYLQGLPELGKD